MRWIAGALVMRAAGARAERYPEEPLRVLGRHLKSALVAVGYRLFSGPRTSFFKPPPEREPRRMSIDLFVGARWWYLRNSIGTLIPTVTPGRIRLRMNEEWWDRLSRPARVLS